MLPERPAGTGHFTEEEFVPLVTRDAMVGVAKVAAPWPRHWTSRARPHRRAPMVSWSSPNPGRAAPSAWLSAYTRRAP
ncbi:nitrile hydratase subunit alpha [Streptomyces sp. NBC_01594]